MAEAKQCKKNPPPTVLVQSVDVWSCRPLVAIVLSALAWVNGSAGAVEQPSMAPNAPVVVASSLGKSAKLVPIELTLVDPDVRTNSGTYNSHNQKVVQNSRGIFMTHVRTRNKPYTSQEWRLSWSRDGGRSFTTLCEGTDPTSPGTLETDPEDNLYMGRPNFADKQAYLYRFLASKDYRDPQITRIPDGAGGKYAMALDLPRRQIYWISHNRTFTRLDMEGRALSTGRLFAPGTPAVIGYPHMNIDPQGVLHVAWTTVMVPAPRPVRPIYWDIHYMQSPDGGLSWRSMAHSALSLPIPADNTGRTDRISADEDYGGSNWLANMLVKEGKAHFMYQAQKYPAHQRYMRFDLERHERDLNFQPKFTGQSLAISGHDGFFVSRSGENGSTLYCVSEEAASSRLVCLASDDNGATWRDYAMSERVDSPYSIGGCREITPDGWIIGSFTELIQPRDPRNQFGPARVYFYRIRTGNVAPPQSAVRL